MNTLRSIIKRLPGARVVYGKYVSLALRLRSTEQIFSNIYRGGRFGGKESASGPGSDLTQTQTLVTDLPGLLGDYRIRTLLDIPCGDFHWMKHVNMDTVEYVGGDIVAELIQQNTQDYEAQNTHFRTLNLIDDTLPQVDLILCRDCLVHFSFRDAFRALHNICDSGSTYLLTTTFVSRHSNRDIATGQWRTLNLQVAPFMLPSPLCTLNECCTIRGGDYSDKSLGLWRIADVRDALVRRCR